MTQTDETIRLGSASEVYTAITSLLTAVRWEAGFDGVASVFGSARRTIGAFTQRGLNSEYEPTSEEDFTLNVLLAIHGSGVRQSTILVGSQPMLEVVPAGVRVLFTAPIPNTGEADHLAVVEISGYGGEAAGLLGPHTYACTMPTLAPRLTPTPAQPIAERSDELEVGEVDGWGLVMVGLTESAMAGMPARARTLARVSLPSHSLHAAATVFLTGGRFMVTPSLPDRLTPEGMRAQAMAAWRAEATSRLRSNMRVGDGQRERDSLRHRQTTEQNWERFARRAASSEQSVATLPFVPHGLASSRRWGIEVESGGARDVERPNGWRRVYDGSLSSAYDGYVEVQDFEPYYETRTRRTRWSDCIHSHTPYITEYSALRIEHIYVPNPEYTPANECESCLPQDYEHLIEPEEIRHVAEEGDCAEFVSPILVSMHSRGLEYLCDELSSRPQNDTAGIHVHVEASDLSDKQIATLIYGYDVMEPLLEASYRRQSRQYCRRRSAGEVLQAARSAGRDTEGSFDVRGGTRYVTLNTCSLNEHGTVEFRAMGPVYDYEYLSRWAMFCREVVNIVAAGVTTKQFSKVRTWQDVVNLMARYGKEFIRASTYEMTGETGEVARLLKGNEPVTTEALDLDLGALDRVSVGLDITLDDLVARTGELVGAGSTDET